MDFGFGEDQELLRSTTRRFLAEHQSLAVVRRSLEEPDVFDADLWRRGAELGWTAMLVPPEYEGGSVTEQPLVDLVVLAEELGRTLNPGPFVGCNVVADAIARFGTEVQGKEHLPRIARGEVTAAWCLSGDGSPEPGAVEVRASREGDGWRLDGTARFVHAAHNAAAPAGRGRPAPTTRSATSWCPGPAAGLSERVLTGLDLTRRFAEVRLDAVDRAGQRRAARRLGGGGALPVPGHGPAGGRGRRRRRPASSSRPSTTPSSACSSAGPSGASRPSSTAWPTCSSSSRRMRAAAYYAALALGDGLDDAAEAVATAGAYVGDTFAHLCGESAPAARRHRLHLGARRPPLRAPGQGEPGALRRRRLAPRAPGRAWPRRPSARGRGPDRGRDRPGHPGHLRRVPPASCARSSPSTSRRSSGSSAAACVSPTAPRMWSCCAPTSGPSTTPGTSRTVSRPSGATPYEQRIMEQEFAAAGIPHVLGQPAGGRSPQALRHRRATQPPTSRRWRGATTSGPSCSASPTPGATSPGSRPGAPGTATTTSSSARRSGARGPSGPTSGTCWPAPSPSTARAASPPSSSTCAARASTSARCGR